MGAEPSRYRLSPQAPVERVPELLPFPFSWLRPEQRRRQVEPRWQPPSQLGPVWAVVEAEEAEAGRAALGT